MKANNQKNKIDWHIISQMSKMRTEMGYSQEDIGVHLNLSTGFIGHIESPAFRAKYNNTHLNELARLFKCSPKDFFPNKSL